MSRFPMLGGTGLIEVPVRSNGNGNGRPPTEGEETGPQRGRRGGGAVGWGSGGIGGTGLDGATVPYSLAMGTPVGREQFGGAALTSSLWPLLFGETYSTYRIMRTQPTLALARSLTMAPIISSSATVEATRENVPEAWVNWARDHYLPHRRKLVTSALRALDFGNSKFEIVWKYVARDGVWGYDRFKPLAVETNSVLIDQRTGKFAGIRPAGGRPTGEDDLGPQKAWVFAYDDENGGPLGRSRFENVRATGWVDWLGAIGKNAKLRDKIAGIIPIFYHPPGSFEEPEGSGNWITYQQSCRQAAEAIMRGDYVTIEHLGFSATDIRNNPDLLKAGLVSLDFYNGGDYARAQDGMIKNLEYDDRLLMRGYLMPERSATEARNSGGRADAEVGADAATTVIEQVADDLDEAQTDGPLAEGLAVVFGEDARGAVRVKTAPLVNRKAAVSERIITALIKAGVTRPFLETLNVDSMLETMDVPQLLAWITAMTNADNAAAIEAQNNARALPAPGDTTPGGGGGDNPPPDPADPANG